jgi:hypothetical protein
MSEARRALGNASADVAQLSPILTLASLALLEKLSERWTRRNVAVIALLGASTERVVEPVTSWSEAYRHTFGALDRLPTTESDSRNKIAISAAAKALARIPTDAQKTWFNALPPDLKTAIRQHRKELRGIV